MWRGRADAVRGELGAACSASGMVGKRPDEGSKVEGRCADACEYVEVADEPVVSAVWGSVAEVWKFCAHVEP